MVHLPKIAKNTLKTSIALLHFSGVPVIINVLNTLTLARWTVGAEVLGRGKEWGDISALNIF